MMMTWKPTPVPDEQAFAAIKAGIDSLPPGAKMYFNSGQLMHFEIAPGHPTSRAYTFRCYFSLQANTMEQA